MEGLNARDLFEYNKEFKKQNRRQLVALQVLSTANN